MKVAIDITTLIQARPTGVQKVTADFTRQLIEDNPDCVFRLFAIAPREMKKSLQELPLGNYPNAEMTILGVPARLFGQIGQWWQKVGWPPIERFVGEVDVYHSFDWFHFPSNCPATSLVFDMTTRLFPAWHTKENVGSQQRRLESVRKRTEVVFMLSKSTRRDYLKNYPNKKGTTHLLYPDCSPDFSPVSENEKMKVRKKYGLPNNFVLFVGTMEPRKNLARTMQAFLGMSESVRNHYSLVITGAYGWKQAEVYKQLDDCEKCIVTDYIDENDMPSLYSASEGLIYSSLYEGFGLPVLEAMRCGCVVLTSKSSSLVEVGGEAVLYCDPLEVDSIRDGITRLLTLSESERQKWIQRGRNQAERFSYEKSALIMMDVFEAIS